MVDSGNVYYPPRITKRHLRDCKEGYYHILDLKNNRDCIGGEWVQNKV